MKIFRIYIIAKIDCFLKRDFVYIYMMNQTQPLLTNKLIHITMNLINFICYRLQNTKTYVRIFNRFLISVFVAMMNRNSRRSARGCTKNGSRTRKIFAINLDSK